MSDSQQFLGKSVLVTGASQGIGLAIAEAFADAGAQLTILAENSSIHVAGATLSARQGKTVRALQCDISDQAEVSAAVSSIGRIDVLVNNAGFQPKTPILAPGPAVDADFRRVIDINVLGTYYVTRAALQIMDPGSRIIFTSSIWGRTGAAEYSGYAASKHAVIGFMRSLAMELGHRNITANAVCPGWVETEGAMWTVRTEAEANNETVELTVDRYLRGQPIAGLMQPKAVAPMYLFLASGAAADITGQCINVDRGSFIG